MITQLPVGSSVWFPGVAHSEGKGGPVMYEQSHKVSTEEEQCQDVLIVYSKHAVAA